MRQQYSDVECWVANVRDLRIEQLRSAWSKQDIGGLNVGVDQGAFRLEVAVVRRIDGRDQVRIVAYRRSDLGDRR